MVFLGVGFKFLKFESFTGTKNRSIFFKAPKVIQSERTCLTSRNSGNSIGHPELSPNPFAKIRLFELSRKSAARQGPRHNYRRFNSGRGRQPALGAFKPIGCRLWNMLPARHGPFWPWGCFSTLVSDQSKTSVRRFKPPAGAGAM